MSGHLFQLLTVLIIVLRQRTLSVFVGVVISRYYTTVVLIMGCHNSRTHSQSPLTILLHNVHICHS